MPMRVRLSLLSIPALLAALGLWAAIGGWYVAVVPPGLSGADNVGIVLSCFGACLVVADRAVGRWLGRDCWVLFFKLWFWGLLFAAWGLWEWLRAFQARHWGWFAVHWLAFALVVAASWLLLGRRPGERAPAARERNASGPISLRPR